MKDINHYQKAQYSVEIELAKTPREVFDHLINLSGWWPEEFVGEGIRPDAEFTLQTGEGHYSKNKVTDFIQDHKMAWVTTESLRQSDQFDWTGTKMIFEITPKGNRTILRFTYDGVILEKDSERLILICDLTIKDMFYNYIQGGKRVN